MAGRDDEQNNARLNGDQAPVSAAGSNPPGQGEGGSPFLGFVGSFTHGIDAKGRMIIPAPFRDALGSKFAVCPTPDFKAIAIYSLPGWIERRDELVHLTRINAKAQRLLDQFSKYSYIDCETDAQGRLLLPQKIRTWRLGDASQVDVNGAFSHIRVLPAETGKQQDASFDEEFADPLALIADIQRGAQF
jgi:MraZ protein